MAKGNYENAVFWLGKDSELRRKCQANDYFIFYSIALVFFY